MDITEKQYNGHLFDQLTILERIERALARGSEPAKEEIGFIKEEINRKLYVL